jgi:hypothetical protein
MSTLNVSPYWQAVIRIETTLPTNETIFITSLEKPLDPQWRSGVVFEADRRNTARRLVETTHRLSTTEEIEQYRTAKKRREQDLAVENQLRAQRETRILSIGRERLLKLGEV